MSRDNFYSVESPQQQETTYTTSSATHELASTPLTSNFMACRQQIQQQNGISSSPPTVGGGVGGNHVQNLTLDPKLLRSRAQYGRFADRPWYYGKISRDDSDKVLGQYGYEGDYLVRDSESNVRKSFVNLKKIN